MPDAPSIPPPIEIAWIVDLVGEAPALRLIEERGGTRAHFPVTPTETSPLARIVGLPAARSLCAKVGRQNIKIPSAKAWRAHVYRARGDRVTEIARRLGWDEATAHRKLRRPIDTGRPGRPGAPSRQLSLFR